MVIDFTKCNLRKFSKGSVSEVNILVNSEKKEGEEIRNFGQNIYPQGGSPRTME